MGNIVTSHAKGSGSIPGQISFLVEVFSGAFLNRKTNIRKFGPHSSPVIICPSYVIQNHVSLVYDGDGL